MIFPLAGSTLNEAIPGPDDLISGHIRTMPYPVTAATYVRGEVVELDGTTKKLKKLTAAANSLAVMPFDITLAADTTMAVYIGGDFNEDKLALNGQTLVDVKTALRKVGIMARKWGAAS